jgi:calcium-dependent protein kinase
LIDFGIAVRRTHSEPLSARIGTPYYIAPEVLCKRYDEKCDIWSVGVILYMMLCFKPPFSGDTEIEVMEKIIKADPNYQIPAFNNVTRDCLDFLKKILCKNPEKRLSAL